MKIVQQALVHALAKLGTVRESWLRRGLLGRMRIALSKGACYPIFVPGLMLNILLSIGAVITELDRHGEKFYWDFYLVQAWRKAAGRSFY